MLCISKPIHSVDKICDYCGKEAKYQLSNGKYCCNETYNKCEAIKKKNSDSNKGRKLNNFIKLNKIDQNILCENGCGKIAKYITKRGKKYCEDNHQKCLINRRKNRLGNLGKTCPSGKDHKMYGVKRPEHSELMKKKNPMFNNTYKEKVKQITKSEKYKKKMSETLKQNYVDHPEIKQIQSEKAKQMWEKPNFKNLFRKTLVERGLMISDNNLSEYRLYRRKVAQYTQESILKHWDKINPNNLPIGKNLYSVDHIFSIFEGFKQRIDPKIIGNFHNLQVIKFSDNAKKRTKCWITKEELERLCE